MEKLKKLLIYFMMAIFSVTFARHFIEYPIISIGFVCLVGFIAYKCDLPKFGVWLFFFSFILRILAVVIIDTPIMSDYKVQYDIAKEIFSGNLNVVKTAEFGYMLRWGYQMGYTLFMTFLMFICNEVIFIKIVNCFFTSLIVLLIYLISKELTNKRVARVISVIYTFFPFPLFFNTILSNQHLSSLLFLLAVYIFISKKTKHMNNTLKFFLIGLCLALGNIIRPEAIIFIFSIFLFMILNLKKDTIKQTIKLFFILIITYLVITISASTVAIKTGVSPSGFENKEPLWKIAVGFNQETKGDYNMNLAGLYFSISSEERIQIVYDYTIGSIEKIPSLFMYKEQHFWLDHELFWSFRHLDNKKVNIFNHQILFNNIKTVLNSINQFYVYTIFGLGVIGIFINRKNMSNSKLLIFIIIAVYSGVYLLIECTPRYAYTAQIFMLLMGSYTLDYLFNYFKNKKNKKTMAEVKAKYEKRPKKKHKPKKINII